MYTVRVMLVWVLFILIIVLIDILHQLSSIMNIVRYNYNIYNYYPTKGVPFFVQRLLWKITLHCLQLFSENWSFFLEDFRCQLPA